MKKIIITISREFGCGGRQIAVKLALALGIPCYDRALIERAAEKSGMTEEFIESVEAKAAKSFLYNLSTMMFTADSTYITYDLNPNDKAYFAQAEVIRELANEGSCVIIGRCADQVLADRNDCIHVFLYGKKEDRLRRAVEEYGLTEKDAAASVRDVDRGRANYYKLYTGKIWGGAKNYDLYINTSTSGIDGAVAAIAGLAKEKMK